MTKPIVGITMGDPAGNGPEITIKALAHADIYDRCRPIVVGDAKMLEQAKGFGALHLGDGVLPYRHPRMIDETRLLESGQNHTRKVA